MNELKLKPIAWVNLKNKSWRRSSQEVYVRLKSKKKEEGLNMEFGEIVLVRDGMLFCRVI